jgi:hypothetical protein
MLVVPVRDLDRIREYVRWLNEKYELRRKRPEPTEPWLKDKQKDEMAKRQHQRPRIREALKAQLTQKWRRQTEGPTLPRVQRLRRTARWPDNA